ncbi:MAG: helix-turn-helix domain-containing protein, partial [Pseudomonadota bacterium]
VVGRAGLSLRTAQRLAAQQNTNLQAMIDAARAANAKAFLADPAISIETMAALLGYSDDRAFRRAFKRWTGATPSAYRRGVR